MSTEQFRHVNALIDNGDIDVARMVLQTMDDVQARSWLDRLDSTVEYDARGDLGKLIAEFPYANPFAYLIRAIGTYLGIIGLVASLIALVLGYPVTFGLFMVAGLGFILSEVYQMRRNAKNPLPIKIHQRGLIIPQDGELHYIHWNGMNYLTANAETGEDSVKIVSDSGKSFVFSRNIVEFFRFARLFQKHFNTHKLAQYRILKAGKFDPIFTVNRSFENLRAMAVSIPILMGFVLLLILSVDGFSTFFFKCVSLAIVLSTLGVLLTIWAFIQQPRTYQFVSDGLEMFWRKKREKIEWRQVTAIRADQDELELKLTNNQTFKTQIGPEPMQLFNANLVRAWIVHEVCPIVANHLVEQLRKGETLKFKKFSMTRFGLEGKQTLSWADFATKPVSIESLKAVGIAWKDDEWNALAIWQVFRHFKVNVER